MNPIEQLRHEVENPRERVAQTHRNEWPDLWAAIDRVVAQQPDDYVMVPFAVDEVAAISDVVRGLRETRVIEMGSDEVREIQVETEVPPPTDVAEAEFLSSETRPTEYERGVTIPLSEIVTFVGTDPKLWATWFKALLEEDPNPPVDLIEEWFALALNARAIEETEFSPMIQVIVNEQGKTISMTTLSNAEVGALYGEWNEDEPGLDPDRPTLVDPENPGFDG